MKRLHLLNIKDRLRTFQKLILGSRMTVQERRQHLRIDDQLFFDYCVIENKNGQSENEVIHELLSPSQQYIDTSNYFNDIEQEMKGLTQSIAMKDPSTAHYLNLINTKVDLLMRQLLISKKINLQPINISLGGLAFKAQSKIEPKTKAKILIYTKPKMTPILISGTCLNWQFEDKRYRIALQFEGLNSNQEQLLAQHILLAQLRHCRGNGC